jgi:hypothetical protein
MNHIAIHRKAFVSDLATATGKNCRTASVPAAPAATPKPYSSETVDEMKSQKFQANKAGFVVGATMVLKKSTGTPKVFEIVSLNDDEVHGKEHTNVKDDPAASLVSVSHGDLLDKWKLFKGKLTQLLDGYDYTVHQPTASQQWAYDASRAMCITAIRNCFVNNKSEMDDQNTKIQVCQDPYMVVAVAAIKKHELKLYFASNRIEKKPSNISVSLGRPGTNNGCDSELFLLYQLTTPFNKATGEPQTDVWVAPAWLVKCAKQTAPDDANMVLAYDYKDVMGYNVSVPYITNNKPVKKYQVYGLTMFRVNLLGLVLGRIAYMYSHSSRVGRCKYTGKLFEYVCRCICVVMYGLHSVYMHICMQELLLPFDELKKSKPEFKLTKKRKADQE